MTYPEKLGSILVQLTNFAGINSFGEAVYVPYDVTSYVRNGSLQIKNILTRQVDTCSFELLSSIYTPSAWDEVTISIGATRLFAGYVQAVKVEPLGIGSSQLVYQVDCADYTALLTKTVVKAEYENMTDAAMLAGLFAIYLSEVDATTYVHAVKTHDRRRFNRKSLREILDELSESAGADWYIDYSKKVHYFLTEESFAPFNLVDVGSANYSTTYPHQKLVLDTNGTGVVNRVEVVGGNYRSEDQTIYLAGTGQDARVILPFKAHAPTGQTSIQVWRNDGTLLSPSWTSLTVKVGYIESLGATTEVLHYFSEKVLEQQNAWPALSNAVKVTAKFEVPLRARVRDQASYNHYGLWLDGLIVDSNLTTRDTARMAGRGLLAEKALASTALSCTAWQSGLRAGMTIHVTDALQGINADYLIHDVTTKVVDLKYVIYELQLGTFNASLVDIIAALARSSKQEPTWRDDEVLDEILEQIDGITLTESVAAPSTSNGPYNWSPTGTGAFNWGFGAWG
jgi:hypothetical protein